MGCVGLEQDRIASVEAVGLTSDVDLDDAKDCLVKFRSNRFIGWILFAGIVLDRLMG